MIKHLDPGRALVLFSGGQDSTTSLAYALSTYDHVETVGFDYGQRNRVELECRPEIISKIRDEFPEWGAKLGADRVLDLSTFSSLSSSALTDNTSEITIGETGLPTTFVPGRNLFFFHYAAVLGYNLNLGVLVGGMCQTDYSGYPDCREECLQQLLLSLNLGMETDFSLITPLMHKTKAQSLSMANDLGGEVLTRILIEDTHSCYEGVREELHEWGYGCGDCPACTLREKGYREWRSS